MFPFFSSSIVIHQVPDTTQVLDFTLRAILQYNAHLGHFIDPFNDIFIFQYHFFPKIQVFYFSQ